MSTEIVRYKDDCKGSQKRANIVRNYIVIPQFAMRLLPGQSFWNCCKGKYVEYDNKIDHTVYVYLIQKKANPSYEQVLVMGGHCSNKIILAASRNGQNISEPKIINMLSTESSGQTTAGGNFQNTTISENATINQQLKKAIVLVVMLAWQSRELKARLSRTIVRLSDPSQTDILCEDEITYFFGHVLANDNKWTGTPRNLEQIHTDVLKKIPDLGNMSFAKLESKYNDIVASRTL